MGDGTKEVLVDEGCRRMISSVKLENEQKH
jgi:hypothetical protein